MLVHEVCEVVGEREREWWGEGEREREREGEKERDRDVFREKESQGLSASLLTPHPHPSPQMNFSIASNGPSVSAPQTVHLSSNLASMGNDLNLTEIENQANRRVWTGTNYHGELGNSTSVAMIVTDPSGSTSISVTEQPQTMTFLTVVTTSLNSTDPLKDAEDLYLKAAATKDGLFDSHASAWADRWGNGSLVVEGDLGLAQVCSGSRAAAGGGVERERNIQTNKQTNSTTSDPRRASTHPSTQYGPRSGQTGRTV